MFGADMHYFGSIIIGAELGVGLQDSFIERLDEALVLPKGRIYQKNTTSEAKN
jgi:hypothetical protein